MKRSFLLAATLGAAAIAAGFLLTGDVDGRLDGEYGLYVAWRADSLHVGWITSPAAPGRLEIVRGGRVEHAFDTPSGDAHAVVFPARRRGEVVLRYGAAGALHETRVDLERPRRPRVTASAVDSLFIMSDVHGEFDTLTAVLRNAGLIGETNAWSGGTAHLVFAGDLMDRGPDVTRVLWFLYGLEHQAREAGGALHMVAGNHEIMVLLADLRYVHEKEAALARLHGVSYDRMFDPRRTILGAWLTSKPGMIRIGDVLIAHGGVSTDQLPYTLRSFDDSLSKFVSEDLFYYWADTTATLPPMDSVSYFRRADFFFDDRSVFWYRGYARSDSLNAELRAVLDRFDAAIHVIGHTPGEGIRQAYGDSLIMVNTVPLGTELLLLERSGKSYNRYRFRTSGPPEPL